MKQTISLIALVIFTVAVAASQTLNDAVKLLNYGKNKSAKDQLEKMVAANSNDANAVYWLGETFIAMDDVTGAKNLFQKSLQGGLNNALLYIGMAHVDLLQGGDWNSANQKFESAITTTAETRGKNKGKAPAYILNAIGRANCMGHLVKDGSSKFGNPEYAIEKLKQASEIDATNTECFIYMGLCYRKMGGEYGGEAQKAYMEALSRDSRNVLANYLIGKIYLSQQNKRFMDQYFDAALAIDPAFPPVYLDNYNYYSNRDVALAKDNIEKYLQYADKDCNNDYFYADYLFRAAKFQESIAKAKELENSDCKMRVPVLYAYNYDKLKDSLQARANIEKFLATATPEKIFQSDYDIAAKILSGFPGSETQAISYIDKALEMETSKNDQLQYFSQKADLYEKAKMYSQQITALQKIVELKGSTSEFDYYRLSNVAQLAKNYALGLEIAKKYLAAFPDKSQPVSFYRKSAIGLDPDTTKGLAIQPLLDLNAELEKDVEKNRKTLFGNDYYMLLYYADKVKDYAKAIEVLDKMLVLYPNEGEENKFITEQKSFMQKALANPPKKTK